jgi:transcriptional regulator with GAF, ATPase, and Fis domain
MKRERQLAATFVRLADTLVAEYDVVDLLQQLVDTCAEILDASAAGLLLAAENDGLDLVASTSERSRLVDTLQLSSGAGPSIETFRTGRQVAVADVDDVPAEWSEFRERALAEGFHSVHAVPLRLRDSIIGCLTLFRTMPGRLSDEDASVAQGLADVATIGILHERALRESTIATEQLQYALESRVVIEQAKGVIAQRGGVDMDEAFRRLRGYARSNNANLRDVASRIISRELDIEADGTASRRG